MNEESHVTDKGLEIGDRNRKCIRVEEFEEHDGKECEPPRLGCRRVGLVGTEAELIVSAT